jgi:hypothetical protein
MMNKPASYQMYHMIFKSCYGVRCAASNLEVLSHFLAIVASTFTTLCLPPKQQQQQQQIS